MRPPPPDGSLVFCLLGVAFLSVMAALYTNTLNIALLAAGALCLGMNLGIWLEGQA